MEKLSGSRVLILEDQWMVASDLAEALEKEGAAVSIAPLQLSTGGCLMEAATPFAKSSSSAAFPTWPTPVFRAEPESGTLPKPAPPQVIIDILAKRLGRRGSGDR